ncbi:MAG: hypothetical protein ACRDGD_08820 [Candidatus Limnocylindria bacterium]
MPRTHTAAGDAMIVESPATATNDGSIGPGHRVAAGDGHVRHLVGG